MMTQIQYLKSVINTLELDMRRGGMHIQSQLGDVFAWGRRVSEFCEQSESALDSLGISLNDPSIIAKSIDDCDEDFRYVHRRMLNLKSRTYDLLSAVNGFMNLLEAQRSLEEAKSVKTLTILGIFFVPLAFASGLFSMGDNFAPGKSQFWVYWVVAVPLVVFVFFCTISTGALRFVAK